MNTMTGPEKQATLFSMLSDGGDWPQISKPEYDRDATIEEKFMAFHQANPHVYEAMREMALELKARGFQQWGVKALYEVLRFEYAMQTSHEQGEFRLNNNYTALYSRMLMDNEPELLGFFEVRERRTQ